MFWEVCSGSTGVNSPELREPVVGGLAEFKILGVCHLMRIQVKRIHTDQVGWGMIPVGIRAHEEFTSGD
jgi:hypothetical protein